MGKPKSKIKKLTEFVKQLNELAIEIISLVGWMLILIELLT